MLERAAFLAAIALAVPAHGAFLQRGGGPAALGHGGQPLTPPGTYQGPCDVIAEGCAEAYSVTRAMRAAYAGPLFQLWNGTTTLDIGQTTAHKADLSTWSAFCSGVQSNCKFGIIYAQVQGTANNLVPAVFNAPFGPNCSTGGAYQCAAPFLIESTSGLPMASTTAPNEYALVSDNYATGINGGTSPISIFYNGQPVTSLYCCGVFGISHHYNAGDTEGTDFILGLIYGQNPPNGAGCQASNGYCVGVDLELAGAQGADYSTTLIANAFVVIAWPGSGSTDIGIWLNSHLQPLIYITPGVSINVPTAVHFGGGGDLSQPAPAKMREAAIINGTLTSADDTALFANETAFYSGLSFP